VREEGAVSAANNPPGRPGAKPDLPPDLLPSVRLTADEISLLIRRLEEDAADFAGAQKRTGVDFTALTEFLRDRAGKLRAALAEAGDWA
jgi:hypothetical protein